MLIRGIRTEQDEQEEAHQTRTNKTAKKNNNQGTHDTDNDNISRGEKEAGK